jgi:hypothetical protein
MLADDFFLNLVFFFHFFNYIFFAVTLHIIKAARLTFYSRGHNSKEKKNFSLVAVIKINKNFFKISIWIPIK